MTNNHMHSHLQPINGCQRTECKVKYSEKWEEAEISEGSNQHTHKKNLILTHWTSDLVG